jgi:hypothetical protein
MILESIIKNDIQSLYKKISNKFQEILAESIEDMRTYISDDAINEQRFKITNRVRGGKIQRRKKISTMPGYRFQDGKLVRMSAREKLNRKRSQRKGAIKRKSKVATSLRKRKISIRKRGAI